MKHPTDDLLQVERIGGLAGFGSLGSKIKSRGQVSLASLNEEDQLALEGLFIASRKSKLPTVADGFCYKISRNAKHGVETIEVPEAVVPGSITQCVKDELS